MKQGGGYVFIKAPEDYPGKTYKRSDGLELVLEHRYVWWKHTGKTLEDGEVIHHINHDKADNRIENLEVMTNSAHSSHHGKVKPTTAAHGGQRRYAKGCRCVKCKKGNTERALALRKYKKRRILCCNGDDGRSLPLLGHTHRHDSVKFCQFCGRRFFNGVGETPWPIIIPGSSNR